MAIKVVNKLNNDSGEHWKDCNLRSAYRMVSEPGLMGIKLPTGQFLCLTSNRPTNAFAMWQPEPDSVWVEVNLDIEVYDA